ncbi:MAG: DUF4199 domain-containing protein [Candidatus Azobacteroides sp.]|nr:DUF4199 domain-containing protein [Candidatus Azobacteroides sp.]
MNNITKQKERASLFFKYTMYYGLLMGLYLVFTFLCVVWGTYSNNDILLLYFVPMIFIPFLAYFLVKKYRNEGLNGEINFSFAWNFGTLMFFFAAMILAIVQYVFLQYISPEFYTNVIKSITHFMENYLNQVPANEINQQQVELMKSQMQQLSELPAYSAIEIAVQNLWSSLLWGIIISIPVAFLVKRNPKKNDSPPTLTHNS